jgi:hypothetical protein
MDDLQNSTTSNSKKASVITLAIDNNILEEIRKEAEKEGKTLSAKVNDILTKHIVLYRFAQDTKCIIINSKTFHFIVDQLDEKLLLEDFMANAVDFVSTFFHAKNIPFTLDNFIKYAGEGTGLHGGIYQHFHYYKDSNGIMTLVYRHNYGIKWSRILSKGLSHQIKSMLNYTTTSEILPSSVIIKIIKND